METPQPEQELDQNIQLKIREAQTIASERQQQRQKMKDELRAAKARGVRFIQLGNTTVAYRRNFQIVRFATAIRSPRDPFDIWVGRTIALHRLEHGECATFRMRPHWTPKDLFEFIGDRALS